MVNTAAIEGKLNRENVLNMKTVLIYLCQNFKKNTVLSVRFLIFKTIYSLSSPIRFLMSVAESLKRSLQSVRLAGNTGSCAKGANTINKDHNLYI